jgi:hypothetical protein
MSKHSTIRKVIVATVVSSAIALTSLAGGGVSADGPSSSGKERIPYMHIVLVNANATPAGDDRPTEEVAFYYNRIAFNYATSSSSGPVATYNIENAWPRK